MSGLRCPRFKISWMKLIQISGHLSVHASFGDRSGFDCPVECSTPETKQGDLVHSTPSVMVSCWTVTWRHCFMLAPVVSGTWTPEDGVGGLLFFDSHTDLSCPPCCLTYSWNCWKRSTQRIGVLSQQYADDTCFSVLLIAWAALEVLKLSGGGGGGRVWMSSDKLKLNPNQTEVP